MPIDSLLEIMRELRDPERGCPWDKEQSFLTIAPYTIEEAYEVVDAIEREAYSELRGELGDLLFQVVFHARIAEEKGLFDFNDVVHSVVEKMIRRHPHVFAGQEEQPNWEKEKLIERLKKTEDKGLLSDIAQNLPASKLAVKMQKRAATVGFDWPSVEPVFDKIEEEMAEVRAEIDSNGGQQRLFDEVGDLMFACTNLARKLDVDPEAALRATSQRFKRRFSFIEQQAQEQDRELGKMSLEEMELLWVKAKEAERNN
jgi:MazG family protein